MIPAAAKRDRDVASVASEPSERDWIPLAGPAMQFSCDADGRLARVSDSWLAKLGFTFGEAIGRAFTDFLVPASRDVFVREIRPGLIATGRCDNAELRLAGKDARAVDALLCAEKDKSLSEAWIGVIADVTALRAVQRRLAASEAFYRALVEDQSDMVSLITPEGELIYVNEAHARAFGREPSDFPGRSVFDFVPAHARPALEAHLRRLAEGGPEEETENQIVMPDGRPRWTAWRNRAVIEAESGRTLIHGVGRDIERRVAAERRLKHSEARYRFLTEHSSDMILLLDDTGTRLYASPACRDLVGYEPEEMLAINSWDAVHPDDRERVLAKLSTGVPERNLSYRMRRKDGGYVWVETAGSEVKTESPARRRLVVVRDIEQRVAAEAELKESEARYRLLADNSRDMVIQLDADLVRRYVSPASCEILGLTPEEMVGVKAGDAVHPEDQPRLREVLNSLLSGDLEYDSVVCRRLHRDGYWVWLETQYRLLRDPATGVVTGIIGAVRDISARKAIEEQLAEANRLLALQAVQDGLTGLANRRAFDEAYAGACRRPRIERKNLGLLMIDVDWFKPFNDLYGHPAGDDCLRRIGRAIAMATRTPEDFVARYGGEEFAVLLPNADERAAALVAERVREMVLGMWIAHEASSYRVVTVSLGVASADATAEEVAPERLLDLADQALYRAKAGGRNSVARASSLDLGFAARGRSSRRIHR
jgi:diguanylate cyclase (GGDEF)-like protein/PAS domain S-box-containing protein